MSERFEFTAARKITGLESSFRDMNTRESGYTMGDLIGSILGFPELRGFWPMSSVNESGNVMDISGQARTLTNNNAAPRAVHNNLIPYVSFNGTTQYLSRADEAGLDITGALTIGGWVYYNAVAAGAMITKYNTTSSQRGYSLGTLASGVPQLTISSDGAAVTVVNSGSVSITAATWCFFTGRFTPSSELALFFGKEKYTNTTSIPAAIFNSSAALLLGGINGRASLAGRAALCFLCAAALPDAQINYFFHMSRTLFGV
jgi:hypothetical protein